MCNLSFCKKIFVAILIIAVLVLVVLYILGKNADAINGYFERKVEAMQEQELARAKQKLEDLYRADTYGGKTPEETLDMLIAALEKGDVELASKYYRVEDQAKALEEMQAELASGGSLATSTEFYAGLRKEGKKGCNEEGGGCTIRKQYIYAKDTIVPIVGTKQTFLAKKGTSIDEIVDFVLNKYANAWKMIK